MTNTDHIIVAKDNNLFPVPGLSGTHKDNRKDIGRRTPVSRRMH